MTSLQPPRLQPVGAIVSTAGCVATVAGVSARVGDICRFRLAGQETRRGEVIALAGSQALVWVEDGVEGLGMTTTVSIAAEDALLPAGEGLLGRVIDPFGRPLDGRGPLQFSQRLRVEHPCPPPMLRHRVCKPFATGVRAIDGMLALAVGQRVGIMAPAGVGKTTLLGMLARCCASGVNVIALVGERGREVREFVEESLGPEGLRRSVVVCATSDRSPLERRRAALAATRLAEYFRDEGRQVLLMVDSLTRFARAQRELGLAQGELPTRRGYPSSLFAALPQLLERAGPGAGDGSGDITAIYTVLMEDAESADPVVEEVKSLLDGHIALSRAIAAGGQYPAIDVRNSISRLMDTVVSDTARQQALQVRQIIEKHQEVQPLVQMGEYRAGQDPDADRALALYAPIRSWLAQGLRERSDPRQTQAALADILQ